MNIASHMARSGLAYRDQPAIAIGSTPYLTYGAMADRTARIAGGLRTRFDLLPGDRVALALKNCPEYIELLYACWHAGLVAVPINAKLHQSEFAFILEDSGAALSFATPDLTDTLAPLTSRLIETGSVDYEKLLAADPLPMADRMPGDPAWLFYTSGTTGQPKGAVLSHRNLAVMSWCYFADVDQQAPWRSILHAAPMSHGSGLYGLAHVIQGGCHVIPESAGFDPGEIFDLIGAWPDSVFFAAPTMVKRLLDYKKDRNTDNLKTIIYGGGPMYVEDSLAAIDRFGPKLAQLYGQGESPMTITALSAAMHADTNHPRWLDRLSSVGIPQSAVDVRIANETGNFLPAGEIGEVVVRGDSVMNGYWQNPDATAETIRDGWLHTGDFGVFDNDGFLTLKDRSKDLIISGGSNIYPREVEEVLVHHPDIAEAAVIGRPDREWGETVVAYLVVRDGASPDTAALDSYCLEHMARFKRPKDYRFVDALPKNNYGKIVKRDLRTLDQSGPAKA
ncbi:MAG: AMP-binding protein [Alphaproteobacteria bacterium]